MRTRLFEGAVAVAIALGALTVPSGAAPVQAGSVCTGWRSTLVPPPTIRVYRVALGRVQTVPFQRYVEVVLANEWGPRTPAASLRAGAIAAKQYGWYYARVWRGGSVNGHCYDVSDTTRDQLYNPAKTVYPAARAAVLSTWDVSLRKHGRFFLTGYRPGINVCTAQIDGWHLYQNAASTCVRRYGDSTERVLRRFYSALGVVTMGTGDVTGDLRGDVPILVTDPATGDVTAQVLGSDPRLRTAAATAAASQVLAITPAGSVLGRGMADVTGDGRADIVQLVQDADGGLAVQVLRSTGFGFAPATTWWSVPADIAATAWTGQLQLLVADFTGDLTADVGIVRLLGPGDAGGPLAQLWVLPSTGSALLAPRQYWSAAAGQDLTGSTFAAADVTGDGRADLISLDLVAPPLTNGSSSVLAPPSTSVDVAGSIATATTSGLGASTSWATIAGASPATLAMVPTDFNLDGRADLFIVGQTGAGETGTSLQSAVSTGRSFRLATLAPDVPVTFTFGSTQLLASDVSGDGRPDLVALADAGVDASGASLGITVTRLVANATATGVTVRPWLASTTLPYATVALP